MSPLIHRFSPNLLGRDFVVGDLHGEFARLRASLQELGFDTGADRLFSVGDLVDRGPDSPEALEWLEFPWFHPVLGNHEAMLIDTTLDEVQLRWWLFTNGGEWWLGEDEETRERFRTTLRGLPIACEIGIANNRRVGVVHADMPAGLDWEEFIERLETDTAVQHEALWSRRRICEDGSPPVGGVDEVYCGHTPVATPTTVGNVHFIDTGACFGGPLTVLRIDGRATHDT